MTRAAATKPPGPPVVDLEALLCALILAPRTFARNRFFELFEKPAGARVRGIMRQLSARGGNAAVITGEQVLGDGRVLIKYSVGQLALRRSAALSRLEAAALHFALHRAGLAPLDDADRRIVEQALVSLGPDLGAFR